MKTSLRLGRIKSELNVDLMTQTAFASRKIVTRKKLLYVGLEKRRITLFIAGILFDYQKGVFFNAGISRR